MDETEAQAGYIVSLENEIQRLRDKTIEAIGWAYADCCAALDRGDDPRKAEMPDVLARATNDLSLGSEDQ